MAWLAEKWYVAWALLCAAAIVAGALYYRRNSTAKGARAFFWLFPRLHPQWKFTDGITSFTVILWFVVLIGMAIFLAAAVF